MDCLLGIENLGSIMSFLMRLAELQKFARGPAFMEFIEEDQ